MSDTWKTKKETAAHLKSGLRKFEGIRKIPGFPQPRALGKVLLFNVPEIDDWLAKLPRQTPGSEPEALARGRIYGCDHEQPTALDRGRDRHVSRSLLHVREES